MFSRDSFQVDCLSPILALLAELQIASPLKVKRYKVYKKERFIICTHFIVDDLKLCLNDILDSNVAILIKKFQI